MTRDPLISFIDLTRFDARSRALENQIEDTHLAIEKIAQEEDTMRADLNTFQKALHEKQKKKDAVELELTHIDDQLKQTLKKLDRASNPKEYFSFTAEIEKLKQQKDLLEDELYALITAIEEGEKSYQQTQKKIETLIQELAIKKRSHQTNLTRDMDELEGMKEVRKSLLVGIPDEWLERYEIMRQEIPDAVVPVEFDSCSACFHTLVGKDLQLLHKRALLQCRQCNRFLYIPEAVYGK